MRVHIASDHAGYELKNHLVEVLGADGHEVVDHGAPGYDAEDDYPAYCIPAAEAVVADPGSLGIVIGGSGNGEQIAANKVTGVRAALGYDTETATLARQHNDANVLGIGARMHSLDEATALVRTFLATPFSNEPRHQRRIDLLAEYERGR
ncbi:ribose 5-phosphate isomerase B [Friedmanniella endophytica]|uniref:Ribose-5-phosphate isomerase B n=1 Tax=Microlunatus kandeliicorticis TaxID=1759536 RepID=A0A7W3IVQ9_9ACTN|nr:ribose-5-phosphate isomerase [Microlunatus kandeliicorticis]MBA8796089.1 ribose 5-phosphate isomerase B [Microlunatus kandeliicorticis]